MKLISLLLLVTILNVFGSKTYSQFTRLNLDMKDVPIQSILNAIEEQSEFFFLYSSKMINVTQKVDIHAENKNINEVLDNLLSGTDIKYSFKDQQILLVYKETETATLLQQNTVTGAVKDADTGDPLTGVTILVKGTTFGAISDATGKFSITIPGKEAILVFSFIGFQDQEITATAGAVLNISMSVEVTQISEVVVVGYGTQKKINLTGSVSNVDSKVLESRPIATLAQGLQGSISNLNITQSTGALGQGASYNIRGTTSINGGSPLILVNGIPMDVNLINPNDIDNISVLKDAASAAIYGARAAYGVILITTKNGMKNNKPSISLSMNYSMNKPAVILELMDSMEWMTFMNIGNVRETGLPYWDEYYQAAIAAHYYDPSQAEVFDHPNTSPTVWSYCANTDWPRELLRNSYPMQQYTASVSGGSDKFDYYTSFSYLYQEGITKNFDEKYNRYNFMTNLNYHILEWFTVGTKISLNTSNKIFPPTDDRDGFGENYTSMYQSLRVNYPVYLPDGHYAMPDSNVPNLVQMHREGGYQSRDINDVWMTGIVKLTPVKNMTFNMDYSFNNIDTEELNYWRELPWYEKVGFVGYHGHTYPSAVTRNNSDNRYYVFNAYADYEKVFNEKHYFKAMVGFNQENRLNTSFSAMRNYLMVSSMPYMSLAYGERTVSDAASEYAIRGVFARLNYRFADRYLFEFNGRYDGSSKFSKKDRFAFFPSVSLGWRIDNEAFFTGLKNSINMLKLRVSYGNLGNQNVSGNYPYIATFSSSQVAYLINGALPMTLTAPGLISPTLTWETVTQQNLGVDFAILDSRLTASFDVYRRDTKNMLTRSETLPAVLAVNEPNANAADMKTTGFDLTLGWKHNLRNVRYGITLLLSDYTAEITKFSNPSGIFSDYYVGKKIGEIWGLVTGGIFQTDEEAAALDQSNITGRKREAGDLWFVDLNGDSKITRGSQTLSDRGDMKVIGNSNPRYSFGFKPNVEWKGFDLAIFLQGIAKRDVVLNSAYFVAQYTNQWYVPPKIGTDYWSPENPDAYFPRPLITTGSDVTTTQTRFLQNASYMRLKQLTFGYQIPVNLTRKVRVERIRVYFSGNNLWEMTKMLKISDPEQSGANFYPLNRSISFGANINF